MKQLLLLLLCVPLMFCCVDKEEKKDNKLQDERSRNKPTKELMINTLYDFLDAIKQQDYEKAVSYFISYEDLDKGKALKIGLDKKEFQKTLEDDVKSRIEYDTKKLQEFIYELETNGTFGKVNDIGDEKLKNYIEPILEKDLCYVLFPHAGGEVIAVWKNNKFKFSRLDD